MAKDIRSGAKKILAANSADVAQAGKDGADAAFIDRLTLTPKLIEQMAHGVEQVAQLADPVGQISGRVKRPTGIEVARMRVPIGVIGIIYESRPNVTADAAALCVKSGNACILRGGSEALESNRAIAACVRAGLRSAGLPEAAVQLVDTADRAAVGELITLTEYVDLIVPRGGKELIERLARESRIPMIKHLDGVCHVYLDDSADPEMAVRIADNAKTQRYGTCNTMETLLVAESIAPKVLPRIGTIFKGKNVEMRGDAQTQKLIPEAKAATEKDYYTEWLAPIVSIRVVKGLDEAIEHIAKYGSQHTDAIVAGDRALPQRAGRARRGPRRDAAARDRGRAALRDRRARAGSRCFRLYGRHAARAERRPRARYRPLPAARRRSVREARYLARAAGGRPASADRGVLAPGVQDRGPGGASHSVSRHAGLRERHPRARRARRRPVRPGAARGGGLHRQPQALPVDGPAQEAARGARGAGGHQGARHRRLQHRAHAVDVRARGDRQRRLDAPGQGARRPRAGESPRERRARLRRRGRSERRVGAGRPRRRGGAHHASDGARFLQSGGSLGREDGTVPAQKPQ